VTVKRFDGSNWVTVGTAGFSAGTADYTSLALDSGNTPYVAYVADFNLGYGGMATVSRYDGSNWVTVGTGSVSAGLVRYMSLALDSGNTPYVAYQDFGNKGRATVSKYDGSNWVTVGPAGFSAAWAELMSLALDSGNAPYVVYTDAGNGNKATVMKHDGSNWVTVGTAGFSASAAIYTSLALDSGNAPYVAYEDWGNARKVTVMTYQDATQIELSSFTATAGHGPVILSWETGSEVDNAGFNVYRAETADGPYVQVNAALIPARGDPFGGASYSLQDMPGVGVFHYKLEDVDRSGVRTAHGPVKVQVSPAIRGPLGRPVVPF
jgi:hypothetical protein